MKKLILLMALCSIACTWVRAQSATANPVTSSMREIFDRQSQRIIDAAAEMPADKYGYQPTPDQWTFGKIIAHVVEANFGVCSMISDTPAPKEFKVSETDSKDKLAPALKASLQFCADSMSKLQDSKMGDTVTFFGGHKVPRARAALELVSDLVDHYTQLASYLRLNGMLPPSAQPKKQG